MALKVFGTKLIGSITAGASVIVGGGFGINAAVNGGTINSNDDMGQSGSDINYDYLDLKGLSEGVKTFLKKSDDFVADKTKTTNVILARVVSIPTDQNLTGKNLKCTITQNEEVDCKLWLIKENLTNSNIGKVLYSSLKEISNTTKESPKDSLVVVEFTGQSKKFDEFKNKTITVKDAAEIMKVDFDQVFFKEKVNIGKENIDVLVPLKKNVVTYLAYSFDSYKLFQQNQNANSFSCYLKKDDQSDTTKIQTFDDGCRIIAIDYVNGANKTMTGLQRLLDSKTPINKELAGQEGKRLYFKVVIDMNRFYNVEFNATTAKDIVYAKPNKASNDTKDEGSFYISQTIEEGKVKGKARLMIVKYTGNTATTKIVDKKAYCTLDANFETTNAGADKENKTCKVYGITMPPNITKENFESIDINHEHITSTTTLTTNNYYAFSIRGAIPIENLANQNPIYLYTVNNINADDVDDDETDQTATRHDFKIVGLMDGALIQGGHAILISEIEEMAR